MTALDALRRSGNPGPDRPLLVGAVASVLWLAVVLVLAWIAPAHHAAPGDDAGTNWMLWLTGTLLPLALIWFAVWSARALARLRNEAEDLRAALAQMQPVPEPAVPAELPRPDLARPAPRPVAPVPRRRPSAPAPSAEPQLAGLELGARDAPELTSAELALALNFPDGPDDREAIRCLHLALADPVLARLLRAAQDVVTLLAGQGVYMDDLLIPETDPDLWRRFAQGLRGEEVADLAVIDDTAALDTAAAMLRGDEVFRDVAHHFLRHFDRLLGQRVQRDDSDLLAVLAQVRSGRAFLLLAQATGMLGGGVTRSEIGRDD
ncbi:hypothetical protein RM190_17150 [Paracoccus sp. CPCC 101403]|uniref:Uncharacterized protein n=1 Tax=Paracoccus broussonetiae TaxID=3075834 RepID=A0ABU3EH84_9RHOB|nr:hypothetical protein [Paracoccus sp. CPCC 101403]MDT1063603.1 hypothetical protein [Paracoccus sp. CPCC 101403]